MTKYKDGIYRRLGRVEDSLHELKFDYELLYLKDKVKRLEDITDQLLKHLSLCETTPTLSPYGTIIFSKNAPEKGET